MPNYCSNYVEIRHEDPAKLQAVADAWNSGELFNTLMPRPKSLDITATSATDDSDLRVLYDANFEAHGYAHWYDYNVAEWGTKWDVGRTDGEELCQPRDGMVTLDFDSAWSPPLEAWSKLTDRGYEILSYYYEPGMGFCGIYCSDSGDEHYNIEGTAGDLGIPPELDEFFGISESLHEEEAWDSNFVKEEV